MSQPFDMKRYEANQRRKVIVRDLERLPHTTRNNILEILGIEGKRSDYFQTCVTCHHWESVEPLDPNRPPIERCKKFSIRPPAHVIADGCEHYTNWEDEDIPFN